MAKRKIEIQEPEVEVAQLIDLDENEKKPIWYRTGICRSCRRCSL